MSVRRNIIAGWSAQMIAIPLGIIMMPFVLRTLEESRYGAWLFINAIAGYSGLIYAGFGATINRFAADLFARRDWQQLNRVTSTIQAVYIGCASLVLLFAGAFAWIAPSLDKWGDLPSSDVRISIMIVGVSLALGMVCSTFGGLLIGTQRLDLKSRIEVLLVASRFILVVVFLQREHGLIIMASVFFVVTVLEQVLFIWLAYRQIPTLSVGFRHVDRATFRECFGFSAFSAITVVAEQLIYLTDTVVIGLVLGPIAVVPYQIALRIAQTIQVPIAQIAVVVLPKASALHAADARTALGSLVSRAMGLAFLLSGGALIGSYFFGGMLIDVWIGRSYPASHTVLCILAGAQVVSLPMLIARRSLQGVGEVRLPAFIDIFEAVMNLAISLTLIHWMGIAGVAWGTFISMVFVQLGLMLPYAARRFGLNVWEITGGILRANAPPLFVLLVYSALVHRLNLAPGWLVLCGITAGGGLALGLGALPTYGLAIRLPWRGGTA